jgi:hypothetical protein
MAVELSYLTLFVIKSEAYKKESEIKPTLKKVSALCKMFGFSLFFELESFESILEENLQYPAYVHYQYKNFVVGYYSQSPFEQKILAVKIFAEANNFESVGSHHQLVFSDEDVDLADLELVLKKKFHIH